MRPLITVLSVLLLCLHANAQQFEVAFANGNFTPAVTPKGALILSNSEAVNGKHYRAVQFYALPNQKEKETLEKQGWAFLQYLPQNTYIVALPASYDGSQLASKIRSIFTIPVKFKMDEHLATNKYPDWAKRGAKLEALVNFADDLTPEQMKSLLPVEWKDQALFIHDVNAFRITLSAQQLKQLAAKSYVFYVELYNNTIVPDEIRTRSSHRSNYIDQRNTNGLQLRGNTMNIALNDDGVIGPHIDYKGRLAGSYITWNNGNHGDHCGGIIMGAGNLDPKAEGMASGANIHVYGVSGTYPSGYQAFDSLTNHYNSKSIRVVSTSYSDGLNAGYTTRARNVDIQHRAMPKMMHVFSSGNNGTSTSSYGVAGWANITGGHKMGKNVTTVGNLNYLDVINTSSSRGPANDGRIKPEICAVGTDVYSTVDVNNYASFTGTSMSCPGIAGVYAQLMEGYKLINANVEAPASLLKCVMMNTADDLGNPGPDFIYGFGRVNARRAYNLLTAQQYFEDSLTQGDSAVFNITVPAGISQIRVMTYWPDKEAAANAAKALVNNLNMTVTSPTAVTYNPWVLNSAANATALNSNAVRFVDSLNNMEQVTIDAPTAGNYEVKVKGRTVPFGPQRFYVAYELRNDTPVLIYPIGKEGLIPGLTETIRWDAYGNTSTFSLEYSLNNGTSWTNISSAVPSSSRAFDWIVPTAVTGNALVRVTRNGLSSTSPLPFSIIGLPSGLTVNWVCSDSMSVSYNAVNGATKYKVSILGNKYMDSAGVSSTTTCIARAAGLGTGGWFSVQAMAQGDTCVGRRVYAVTYPAAPFNCVVPADIELASVISPDKATEIYCSNTTLSYPLTINVKNNSTQAQTGVQVGYTLNGVPQTTATIPGAIAANSTTSYTFTPNITLSAGVNVIKVYTIFATDPNSTNDTGSVTKKIIVQTPINAASTPVIQNFDIQTLCDTAANCGIATCNILGGWENMSNGIDDETDWRVWTGATPTRAATNQTGPLGGNPNKYAYIESSNCTNSTALLVSPCITLPATSKFELKYNLQMYGAEIGSLFVDINNGSGWALGVQQTTGNQGDQWLNKSLSLAAYAGTTINIRFRGTTTTGNFGDIALDNIGIKVAASVNDKQLLSDISLYPNPAQEMFSISLPTHIKPLQLEVLDISGKVIKKLGLNGTTVQTVQVNDLAHGVYIVQLQTDKGLWRQKLVKQ